MEGKEPEDFCRRRCQPVGDLRSQTLLGLGLGVSGPVSAVHVLRMWMLLESAPWWGLPVFTLATVFTSCGASVDTVVLCCSSLHCARPSLERELCYYLRKSGSGSAMWFEGKISFFFFFIGHFLKLHLSVIFKFIGGHRSRPRFKKT